MTNKLKILKKRLIYRASYRGTKEMDILLTQFVNRYLNEFASSYLKELDIFLNFQDETIHNFYRHNISNETIDKNKVSQVFKKFKI